MKNILPYLNTDEKIENAVITRGKMTPRKAARHYNYKAGTSKLRRAALKRGEISTQNSQYGGEGHSSWWD